MVHCSQQVSELLERFKRDSAALQPQLRAVIRVVSAMATAAALGAGAGGGRPREPPADPTTCAALTALFKCVPLALPDDVRVDPATLLACLHIAHAWVSC